MFYKHENNLATCKILDFLYKNYVNIVLKSVIDKAIRKDTYILFQISWSFTMSIKPHFCLALILGVMVGDKVAKYLLVHVDEETSNSKSGPGKHMK